MRTRSLLAAALLALVALPSAWAQQPPASQPAESSQARDARMKWWREARFGMFIHWGLYAVPAGTYQGKQIPGIGEWIQNGGNIPVAEYARYAQQFNPVKFNPDQWAAIAKNAGMKYVVITSKHHDGFAMYPSKASPFNIVDATPYKKDVIGSLDTAVRNAGLRFGVYYSQSQDWHHPGGFAYGRNGRKRGEHWDPAQDGSFDDYLQKIAIPQVRELLTSYKLDVLWWDTSGPITKEQAQPLHDLLATQPLLITNNRLGGGFRGDTETPEQFIPPTGYPDGRDWETCMTINDTWGFKSYDHNWKSTETLLRNLIDIASKGGNYLLNVGPTAEGTIPEESITRLEAIGKWLSINGEAIYATSATPFGPEAGSFVTPAATTSAPATAAATKPKFVPTWAWRCTSKPAEHKLYLHLFKWPDHATFTLPAMKGSIASAYLLADPARTPLNVTRGPDGTHTVALPASAPDPIASVVVLNLQ